MAEEEPKPCTCATYQEAVQKGCKRPGGVVSLRTWELCSNQCPPERPCREGLSARYRALWDGLVVPPETNEVQAPGLIQKAMSAGSAMLEWAKEGFKTRTAEEQVAILNICKTSGPDGKACEHFEPANETCKMCGCYLQLKARLVSSSCPVGKW